MKRSHLRVVVLVTVLALASTVTGCRMAHPERHAVEIRDLRFTPTSVTVAVGDTVVWTNHDIVAHTVTGRDGGWDSETLLPGATFTLVVATSASGAYYCQFHPTMTGDLATQ